MILINNKKLLLISTVFLLSAFTALGSCKTFRERATPEYAKGFKITYIENAKLIEIVNPWQHANVVYSYLLVQQGCKKPEGLNPNLTIQIPVKKIVSLSTTHIPFLDRLGMLPQLKGVGDAKLIYNSKVRNLINKNHIKPVGWSRSVDIESLLALEANLVFTFAIGQSGMDDLNKLEHHGIPTILISEYLEENPLGRAEWIKMFSTFVNKETLANRLFSEIEKSYLDQVEQVSLLKKPTVFTGAEYRGLWRVPGGKSYVARLLKDAGAHYLWADNQTRGSLPLDFETVFAKAWNAEFWLNPGSFSKIDDLRDANKHYLMFQATKNDRVFNNNARQNVHGGNDYWDEGLASPHLLLKDLIRIFHPQVFPNHKLKWYQKLD